MAPKNKGKFKLKHYINYIAVTVFLLIFATMTFTVGLPRSTSNLLTQMAYSIILAVSLNLVVGFLGELSLGHAGFMCIGSYIGCYCANMLHKVIPSPLVVLIISMLIGGIVAAAFGFLIGLPALRLKGDYLAIVTLAFGEIVRTIFKNISIFGGAMGMRTKKFDSATLYIVAFIMVLITLFIIQNLIRSKHGRAITSIRENEIAARAMGINVTFYKLFVFVVAAFFAGVAGVLYGHYNTPVLYSFFSYNYSIEILVMVVLGGIGSISGSVISATLITFINFSLQTKLSGDLAAMKNLVYALILIGIIIFNNAPVFRNLKEKLNFKAIWAKVHKKKASDEMSDDAMWHRIPSKISMDELLSVDVKPSALSQSRSGRKDKEGKNGRDNS